MTLKFTISTTYALALLCVAGAAHGQVTQYQPPTDSSAQASPLTAAPKTKADDASAQASPITAEHISSSPSLPAHTALRVVLSEGLDSGHLKNGQEVQGKLSADTQAHGKAPVLRNGTPVTMTVVATVPAGKLISVGELSLQVERVGRVNVFTDTLTFRGKPGHKDLPDSAPAVGTDAGLASGTELTFHVLADPQPADGPPKPGSGPGSVNGVASGSAPPAGSGGSGQSGGGNGTGSIPSGKAPAAVAPASNSFSKPGPTGQPTSGGQPN